MAKAQAPDHDEEQGRALSVGMSELLRLFPPPIEAVPLEGLYLAHALREGDDRALDFVYANFITSLDGRIAFNSPRTGSFSIPQAIANPRDWRLFQELAAQADALIVSGRYVRQLAKGSAQDILPLSEQPQYQDLLEWRRAQGLVPQPAAVIMSASLDLPIPRALLTPNRALFVATGLEADTARVQALEREGLRVVFAGAGQRVQGRSLIDALQHQGLRTIYSAAGPEVLATLLVDRVLDRLYLTQVPRILGGEDYATIVKGPKLSPPAGFKLHSLYYEAPTEDHAGQLFGVYAAAGD
ncbi:MAG: RibD family protein [Gammaproteobacteria bacterium]